MGGDDDENDGSVEVEGQVEEEEIPSCHWWIVAIARLTSGFPFLFCPITNSTLDQKYDYDFTTESLVPFSSSSSSSLPSGFPFRSIFSPFFL